MVPSFRRKAWIFQTKKWHNFKNIPKSLVDFHQKYMCYRMLWSGSVLVGDTDHFLSSGDLAKHGYVIDTEKDLPGVKEQCMSLFSKHNLNTGKPLSGYISPEVSFHGHTYKPGAVLQLNYVEGVPAFGLICQNLMTTKFFILEIFITIGFHSHYNAYVLKPAGNQVVVSFIDTENKWPLSVYHIKDDMYVTNRYSHFAEYA